MRAVLIPGMGCDARLFAPQRALPFAFDVPAWPEPRDDETLEACAERMAGAIGRADLVGGVSFGGMLAQAMAARVGARVVVGIATAKSGRDIPALLRYAEAVARSLPAWRARPAQVLVDLAIPRSLAPEHRDILCRMIPEASIGLVCAGARMTMAWCGSAPPCPARFIHGDRDLVIPARHVKPDRLVRGAGHLINMTHARAVNDFIVDCAREAGLL